MRGALVVRLISPQALYIIGFIALAVSLSIAGFGYMTMVEEPIDLMRDTGIHRQSFSDQWEPQGRSTSELIEKDGFWEFKYLLKQGVQYPYAGVLFQSERDSLLNLLPYVWHLKINVEERHRLPLRVYHYQEGVSDSAEINSYRLFMKIFTLEPGENEIQIPFRELNQSPDWWYTWNKLSESEVPDAYPTQVKHISLFSDPDSIKHKEFTYKIIHSGLEPNMTPYHTLVATSTSLIGVSYAMLLSFAIWRKKRKRYYVPVVVKQINQTSNSLEDQFVAYIANTYHEPNLMSHDVARHLNEPEYKIGPMVKEKFNTSFRDYLNVVRIRAAKELLKESELTVAEVGYKSGFSSPSSFNRTFKKYVRTTPKAYREENQPQED